MTFGQLDELSAKLAHVLSHTYGVQRGMRVQLRSANLVTGQMVVAAAVQLTVPTLVRYRPTRES